MAKILIAEDDTSMRQFLCAALEKAGHQVTACADGLTALTALEESLDKVHEKTDPAPPSVTALTDQNSEAAASDDNNAPYQLLLTDIIMPGMDGIELSQRATRLQPDIKVLFITGFAALPADDPTPVMAKPFHLGQLISQINEILLR